MKHHHAGPAGKGFRIARAKPNGYRVNLGVPRIQMFSGALPPKNIGAFYPMF